MKKPLLQLLTAFALATATSFAHGDVELGPNGGRLLELSKNETVHGEVTVKNGKFQITVLDKEMKPVKMDKQSLVATGGTREKPEKLAVEKNDKGFIVPMVQEGQWLILQFKDTPESKAITARMLFDTETCSACKAPEWICECDKNARKKK